MNARRRLSQLEKQKPTANAKPSIETIRASIQAKLERLARGEPIEPNTEPPTKESEEARRWILERLARLAAVQNGNQ
ncbi:MAG: hypothetical protein FMNOHCHN_03138 [Ignavibacteriaceae bacterium]|nr:hypothetical protein [Ignavibacteriaceae bacterium]